MSADQPPARRRLLATRRGRRALAALAGLAALSLVAGVVVGAAWHDEQRREPLRAERPLVSFLARIVPPIPTGTGNASRPPRTLGEYVRRLPLEAAAAQVIAVSPARTAERTELARLARGGFGAVIVRRSDWGRRADLARLVRQLRDEVRKVGTLQPLLLALQPGGAGNALPAPPALSIGEYATVRQAADAYAAAADAARRNGLQGLVGVPADVAADDEPALGTRVFSTDPAEVATFAELAVRACLERRVVCAPASFPGIGAADRPPDSGPVTVTRDLDSLRERDLVAFAAAFRAGAQAVVVAHALYPFENFSTPASMSRRALVDLLRGELRFSGVAITDDLASPAVRDFVRASDGAVAALRAGADLVWISGTPGDQLAAYAAIVHAVRTHLLPRARLDEAVQRVLLLKRSYGLLARPSAAGR